MKYTCCERLMWHIIAPASLRYLSKRGWDAPSLKKKAKMIYRQIVKRTPNIGGLTGNSLHICLVAGMIWLSIYEAAEGKMGEECFGNMVVAGMESPIVKASFTRKAKAAFTLAAQQKRADKAVRDNAAPGGAFNWQAEVILGRDAEEYTILYRQCGLCTLGRQEELPHLVPYLCALDTLSIDWMGGSLYRTKTLAAGGDCCDFYISRKIQNGTENRKQEDYYADNYGTSRRNDVRDVRGPCERCCPQGVPGKKGHVLPQQRADGDPHGKRH